MQVLVWAGDSVDHFAPSQGTPGTTFYAVFDSNTNTVGALQSVALGHDMFCPGISILPNSEVIVVGGSAGGDGHAASSVFANGAWASGPQLSIPRGYNAAVTLSTGEVCSLLLLVLISHVCVPFVGFKMCFWYFEILKKCFGFQGTVFLHLRHYHNVDQNCPNTTLCLQVMTLGGSFSGGISIDKGAEIFDGNAWRTLPNLKGETILSDDPQGAFRTDNYAHLFAWTGNSGTIFPIFCQCLPDISIQPIWSNVCVSMWCEVGFYMVLDCSIPRWSKQGHELAHWVGRPRGEHHGWRAQPDSDERQCGDVCSGQDFAGRRRPLLLPGATHRPSPPPHSTHS